jgi:hypothetical protein
MLPYIEQGPLYSAFNASIGIEGPSFLGYVVNSTIFTTKIPSFQCPSDNEQVFSLAALSAATGGFVPRGRSPVLCIGSQGYSIACHESQGTEVMSELSAFASAVGRPKGAA